MAVTEEPTPLGARVERTLIELIEAGLRHGPVEKLSIADCDSCQQSLSIARSRIRERMAEPKPEPPVQEGFTSGVTETERVFVAEPDRTAEHISGSKQQKLSRTVYTLLGFNDPDRVAAWINRAHRIANEAAQL